MRFSEIRKLFWEKFQKKMHFSKIIAENGGFLAIMV